MTNNPLPNDDQVKGQMKQAEGRVRDAAADLTDDPTDDLKAKAKTAEGKVQEVVGDVKKAIHNATR